MGFFSKKSKKKQPPVIKFIAPPAPIKRLLSYRAANLQGIGTRRRQEDSFSLINSIDVTKMREKGLLAIVADGMGGMKDGKLASETAVQNIRADFEHFDYEKDFAVQLCSSLYNTSEKVFSLLGGEGGSTAIVCLLYNEKLYYASIGDSFLILKRNGQIYHINRKHTVFNRECSELISSGSMDPSEPKLNLERNALDQYIGVPDVYDIDFFKRPFALENGDIVLLCSDGVGGVLSDEELNSCLIGYNPDDMCRTIEEMIVAKGRKYQDNYTALIIQCEY